MNQVSISTLSFYYLHKYYSIALLLGSTEEKLEDNLKVTENSSSLSNLDKIQVNKECNGQGDHCNINYSNSNGFYTFYSNG